MNTHTNSPASQPWSSMAFFKPSVVAGKSQTYRLNALYMILNEEIIRLSECAYEMQMEHCEDSELDELRDRVDSLEERSVKLHKYAQEKNLKFSPYGIPFYEA